MGWVHEQVPSTAHTHLWQRKFLVLKPQLVQIYATTPVRTA